MFFLNNFVNKVSTISSYERYKGNHQQRAPLARLLNGSVRCITSA